MKEFEKRVVFYPSRPSFLIRPVVEELVNGQGLSVTGVDLEEVRMGLFDWAEFYYELSQKKELYLPSAAKAKRYAFSILDLAATSEEELVPLISSALRQIQIERRVTV